MISNDQELRVTLNRIVQFQKTLENLRQTETNLTNYRLSSEGFLAEIDREIDRMNLEVREYLALHPSEIQRAI